MNKLVELLNGYTAILFQTELPPHAREYYVNQLKQGDSHAQYYLDFLDARETKDYHTLADFIPDNWLELYDEEYRSFLPESRVEFMDTLSLMILGKPILKTREDEEEIYKQQAKEFAKSEAEIKNTNAQTIEGIARTKVFLNLFGAVLPPDEKGETMIPTPMMAKLLGISLEQAEKLIMEYLPLTFDHHSSLSKISTAPLVNRKTLFAS
jgi:hypothetical protein